MANLQDFPFLLLIILALASLTIFVQTIIFFCKRKTKSLLPLPPSPPALPIIGHLYLLGKLPHQALCKVSNRYGPIVFLRFGYKSSLLVSSAEIARECLKTNESCFMNRPKRANFDYLTYGGSDFSVAPYGRYWKFMKKLTVSKLLGASIMEVISVVNFGKLLIIFIYLFFFYFGLYNVGSGKYFPGFTNTIFVLHILFYNGNLCTNFY